MNENRHNQQDSNTEEAAENKIRAAAWLATGVKLNWKLGRRIVVGLFPWLATEEANGNPPSQSQQDRERDQSSHVGRSSDVNVTLAHEEHLFRRRRWGTVLVICSFAASVAGFLIFLTAYWTNGSTQMLGGGVALFLTGWAAAFIFWAHLLIAHKEATEPREDMSESTRKHVAYEQQAFEEELLSGAHEVQRRGLLKWMGAFGVGFVAVMVVSLFRSLGFNPANVLYTRIWKRGQRLMTEDGKPIKADDLPPGGMAIVFPEDSLGSEKAQTVLVRVDPKLLQLPSDRANWAPGGNLAYSRVCTHAGCSVGMYLTTAHLLMCPCHQSTFDVLHAAQPTGGPAARPLPQLPLYVAADGTLRAGGGFSNPPGPGFWGMPS